MKQLQLAYLRDIFDHLVTMLNRLESTHTMAISVQETYLANVNIEINDASNQVNESMKRLSSVTTIVMPITAITAIMGMNVQVPFQQSTEGRHRYEFTEMVPFWTIVFASIALMMAMFAIFRRQQWV